MTEDTEDAEEPTALADVFDRKRGRVTQVAVGPGTWPTAPCGLPVTGHTVRAAWTASGFEQHTVRIFPYGVGRWDLLVVPPETGPTAAGRLMAAAAGPALHLTGSALLAAGEHRPAEDSVPRTAYRGRRTEDGVPEPLGPSGRAAEHPATPHGPNT
ncbi:DUF5994 family protein [Streptomyces sp. NPDC020801]|uniref:DUF5994 family protein n=1 Tax=unclassified Streptomyces TaxID=2593676 RepID=UPI00379DE456